MENESPEAGHVELSEIIDIQSIQSLMNDFYKLAHIPMGLDDLNGKSLVSVGWQDICTKFHRVHPETCKYCFESNKIYPREFHLEILKNISALTICGIWH